MKGRILIAICGGALFPAFYGFALSFIYFFAQLFFSRDSFFYAKMQPIINFPIIWPSYIYYSFVFFDKDYMSFPGWANGNLLCLFAGNFLLYSLLAYFFVSSRKRSFFFRSVPHR